MVKVTGTDSIYRDATVHIEETRITTDHGVYSVDLFVSSVVDSPEYGRDMVMLDAAAVKKNGTRSMQSRKPVVPLSSLPSEIQDAMNAERAKA